MHGGRLAGTGHRTSVDYHRRMPGWYFSGLEFSIGGSFSCYFDRFSHIPTYFGIQYNHAGGVQVRVDHHRWFEHEGPCAFITHPHSHIEYGPVGDRSRQHHYVCFFGPRVQRMIDGSLIDLRMPRPLVPVRQPREFLHGMQTLIAAINGPSPLAIRDRMVLELESLLLQLHHDAREVDAGGPCADRAWFERLMQAIAADPQHRWDFADEASLLHLTPQHFRLRFKRLAGMAPHRFVIEQRLRRAADLLIGGDDAVAAVGAQVGIPDCFYFSRLFKRRFALSPARYRQELRHRGRAGP